jgi:hypothetical protein
MDPGDPKGVLVGQSWVGRFFRFLTFLFEKFFHLAAPPFFVLLTLKKKKKVQMFSEKKTSAQRTKGKTPLLFAHTLVGSCGGPFTHKHGALAPMAFFFFCFETV